MRFARTLLVRLPCGIFRRMEIKLSTLLFRLQWFISTGTSAADKAYLFDQLMQPEVQHCLPSFVRNFAQACPTLDDMTGSVGINLVATLESALAFSTDEVERENAHLRRECSSQGQGRQHRHVVNREVCRVLKQVHLLKGGADPARSPARPASIDTERRSMVPTFLEPPPCRCRCCSYIAGQCCAWAA